jgi:UPF0716 protein FxsA
MSMVDSAGTTSSWGRRIRAFLALIALAEIVVVLGLARFIGGPATVMILLAFTAAGVLVLRRAARRLFRPVAPETGTSGAVSGAVSSDGRQVAEAVPLLGAGILMTVPGILTGVLGTLLLFAPIRRVLRPLAVRAAAPVVARMQRMSAQPQTVPGEVVDEEPRSAQHVDVEIIDISTLEPPPEEGGPSPRS